MDTAEPTLHESALFLRVDRSWKNSPPKLVLTGSEQKDYGDKAFLIIRSLNVRDEFIDFKVKLQDQQLVKEVRDVMKDAKRVPLHEGSPEVSYDVLSHYLHDLASQTSAACVVLCTEMRKDYGEMYEDKERMVKEGVITFDKIWMLFKPSTLAVVHINGLEDRYRCILVDMTERSREFQREKTGEERYTIHGRYISTSGAKSGYAHITVDIPHFSGTKSIRELAAYPLAYAKDKDKLKEALISQSKIFWKLTKQRSITYHYQGLAVIDAENHGMIHFKGEVVLDPLTHRRYNQEGVSYTHIIESLDPNESKFTEEQRLITSPCIAGYFTKEDRWALCFFFNVKEKSWDSRAFESLALHKSTKDQIRGLTQGHRILANNSLEAKGNGVIFLLHGPPGTGKTLTAESLAQNLQLPLMHISASVLGATAEKLRRKLATLFDLSKAWSAILLIDEADTLLNKRRTALTGVMLSSLEYYPGILMMTTNNAREVDSAVLSWVTRSIEYKELTLHERKQLWQKHFSQLVGWEYELSPKDKEICGIKEGEKQEDELQVKVKFKLDLSQSDRDEAADHALNGREIKNAIKLFRSEAFGDWISQGGGKEPIKLTGNHLKTAITDTIEKDSREWVKYFYA